MELGQPPQACRFDRPAITNVRQFRPSLTFDKVASSIPDEEYGLSNVPNEKAVGAESLGFLARVVDELIIANGCVREISTPSRAILTRRRRYRRAARRESA